MSPLERPSSADDPTRPAVDQHTASQIVDHNRRLHDAPGFAERYDTTCGIITHPWERAIFVRDVRHICTRLGTDGPKRALDLGCGTGSLSLLFLEGGLSVVGVDVAAGMLERLRAKAAEQGHQERLHTLLSTVDDYLAATRDTFDVICFSSVLHHLPDYLATLRLVVDHVAPGGIVYIIHEPSMIRRVGLLARILERVDRAAAEVPAFARRQLGDLKRLGLGGFFKQKVLRRRAPSGPAQAQPTPDHTAVAVDHGLVDYHAKRTGIDEQAVAQLLEHAGFEVHLGLYDTKRHRLLHTLCQWLHTQRMLRVVAQRRPLDT
ncbi:class I SAM-dependent methyltransferase [bacterium]|nr:class I SAM-dependent methyltransferase [bacterium]